MSVELKYLTWVSLATSLMWLPYIVNIVIRFGLVKSMGFENRDVAMDAWAVRMKKAHYNAIENLVVFAAFILILNAMGISNENTQCAAAVYFYARVAHYLVYTFGVPWVKTLTYFVGWLATISLACEILK